MKENKIEVFVLNKEGNVSKVLNYLPLPFLYEYRYDLIKRAVLTELQNSKQPKGVDVLAGKRTTAESWGVGYGVARVPRVKGSGYPRASQAAFAPNTVKGYNPTAPKVNKKIRVKINKKEKILALFSAISATKNLELVLRRGHKFDYGKISLPIVIDEDVSSIKKTSDVVDFLKKTTLIEDILRVKETINIRAGKGKRRGRKYKERKSILLVIYDNEPIRYAFKNLPGVDVVDVRNIKVHDLAPGCLPGRLTIWTLKAFEYLAKKYSYIS